MKPTESADPNQGRIKSAGLTISLPQCTPDKRDVAPFTQALQHQTAAKQQNKIRTTQVATYPNTNMPIETFCNKYLSFTLVILAILRYTSSKSHTYTKI